MIMDDAEHDVLAKLLIGQILIVQATLLFGVWAAT
jgi:hypothetical protein